MKRLISIILMLALLLLAVSCAAGGENASDTTAGSVSDNTQDTQEETEFKAFDTVELQRYDGYTFNILYPQADECYRDFYTEDMNGNIKNDSVLLRNMKVEEALGIDIEIKWQAYGQVNTDLQTQVLSGATDYDMYGGHRSSLGLSYAGNLYDITTIDQIDLSGEWWDSAWLDAMSVGNSVYALVGDISVSCLLFISSLCFNKKLFDDNGLDYPYDLVREKKWTYDALYTYIENYSSDANGDGRMSYESDLYGLTGWGTEAGFSLFYGSGFTFVTKDSNDMYELNFNTERLTAIADKVFAVWVTAESYFNNSGTAAEHPYPFSVFTEDRALFCDSVLSKIGTFIASMESDYGILPQPMFDEYQENYCSYTGYTIPITMIPSNCDDASRTGTIIEALCTASYDDVTPDMYEIVTSVKNARDAESSEMIGIIIRTKFFDPAHWFNIAGYGTLSRTMIASKTNDIAASVRSFGRAAEASIMNINSSFEKLQDKNK